jgi:hypothetical protein
MQPVHLDAHLGDDGSNRWVEIAASISNTTCRATLLTSSSAVPKGTEASVFALVTSLQMVGGTAGGALSAVLTEALGVTLRDYSNLANLVIITSCIKLVSLPFVALVPARISVAREGTARSKFGAYLLGTTMVAGTSFAVFTAIFKLVGGSFS